MPIFVPPGGFAGFAQQSPAVQALVRRPGAAKKRRKATTKKRATKRRAAPKRATARRRVAKKKPQRLVKGSAAARAHMAKLRKMRRR